MDYKVILKSLVGFLAGLALLISVAEADECVPVDKFSSAFAQEGIHLLGSNAAATEKLAKVFNDNREHNGQPKAEISIFLLGLVMGDNGTPDVLAAAADKNGCIIQKTIIVMPIRYWVTFMQRAGVTIHDFVPLDGA